MPNNIGLRKAAKNNKDEFYTPMSVIEDELKYYSEYFKDKIVYCNCDNPFESDFFKYFVVNFNDLGLKKLICTCYSDFTNMDEGSYKAEVTRVDEEDIKQIYSKKYIKEFLSKEGNIFTELIEDGDFRSFECTKILEDSDVVVTNPPFSLSKDFIKQMIEYDKKFLIIGNVNLVSNKEIFPFIKNEKMWLGVSIHSGDRKFYVPDDYKFDTIGSGIDDNGRRYIKVKGVRWFTNIHTGNDNKGIVLTKRYDPAVYPKYDYYDAINVDSCKDIPCDYYDNIGVPLTFIDKWSPKQFELVDGMSRYTIMTNEETKQQGKYLSMVNGKTKFFRLIIKRKA